MAGSDYLNPSTQKRSSGLKANILYALALLLMIGAVWFFTEGPLARHKILGSLTVTDLNPGHPGLMMLSSVLCRGTGEYADITAMTDVVVRDGNNTELGTGKLSPGVPIDKDSCEFGFVIEVPNVEVYRFTIEGRGTVVYTHEELAKAGWNAGLVIGED